MAEAPIQPDGTFKAKVADLTKFMEIMRADIVFNEKFQSIVVISQPPIPKGVYKAKVTSMLSKLTAETKLTVKGPTVIDRFKDWIGGLTGKIQHKKAKENQQPGSNFQNSIKGSMVILLPRNGGNGVEN